jgi:hypothetical protein
MLDLIDRRFRKLDILEYGKQTHPNEFVKLDFVTLFNKYVLNSYHTAI